MARILLIASHGSEDPTRAGLAFLFAKGAVEEGHQPEVILAGDAAVLARQTVAENVMPVGLPPHYAPSFVRQPVATSRQSALEAAELATQWNPWKQARGLWGIASCPDL